MEEPLGIMAGGLMRVPNYIPMSPLEKLKTDYTLVIIKIRQGAGGTAVLRHGLMFICICYQGMAGRLNRAKGGISGMYKNMP
jgi:hypothetical protein